jgi:thioredoxin-related protein
VLLFTSATCPWCEKLEPEIAPFVSSLGPDYEVLLVVAGGANGDEARSYVQRLGCGDALKLAAAPELFESYGVPGTPYGLLIDKEGVVRSKGVTNTFTDLRTLVSLLSTKGAR